jgi:signal transduction histidine kinase
VQQEAALLSQLILNRETRLRRFTYLGWSAAVLLPLAAFASWLSIRRSRLRHAASLREKISQDLHDEIGSTLGSISLNAHALSQRATQLDEASRSRLSDMALMARDASQTMRDLVWVVDQRSDDTLHLIQHLRETAARLLGDLPHEFEASAITRPQAVDPDFKRHVMLFFKEALHNILRHAQARSVTMNIALNNEGGWTLSIADDGIGFVMDAESDDSPQLEKLRARARRLQGRLEVRTAPSTGTTLTLHLPAPRRA